MTTPIKGSVPLADLEPQFHTYREEGDGRVFYPDAADLASAQAILFLCPYCFLKNKGAVGTHAVDVTFSDRGVPDHLGSHNRSRKPSRWTVSGTGIADLSLHPSIDLTSEDPEDDCKWHGFITAGQAIV